MSEQVPPQRDNPETLSLEKLWTFEGESIPIPPGTKATPRPVGRERWRTLLGIPPMTIPSPANGTNGEPTLGAIVLLRSGGPPMTVVGFCTPNDPRDAETQGDQIQCGWFHGDEYRFIVVPQASVVVIHESESQGAA